MYGNPTIVVAPNGYGKSTIATAFEAAANGQMKVKEKDLYQCNANNHSKLEVELCGEYSGTYVSTDTEGNISRNITLCTINSPLYAKNTTRSFGRNVAATADLRVEPVIVYSQIPESCSLNYSYRNISSMHGNKKKLFVNISEMLTDYSNIAALLKINDCLKKCCIQTRIQEKFQSFLNSCSENGTAESIKNQISHDKINDIHKNSNIGMLMDCISNMNNKPVGWHDVDVIFTAIQLCDLFKSYFDQGENNILRKVYAFLSYKRTKVLIDEQLDLFNTTGRTVKTHEDHGKLVINFDRALSMSNGERDILSFIANLTKFEVEFKKK